MATSDLVKVALINTIVLGSPGEIVTAFGHQFTIQPNGEAHALVDRAFVDAEVKAGRYVVIDGRKNATMTAKKDLLRDLNLGFEIKNYFGTNDVNKLTEIITNLDRDQIKLFAETRMDLNFPDSMNRVQMIDQISKIVSSQNVPPVEEEKKPRKKRGNKDSLNKTLEELEKLERDLAE